MDNNMYRDEFENFLKDNANDFLMVPSRKVWHSIYNDMHPDRKWPSMAVCLLILTAVLYIGVSTNNSLSNAARRAYAENMLKGQGTTKTDQNNSSDQRTGMVTAEDRSAAYHDIAAENSTTVQDPFIASYTGGSSEGNIAALTNTDPTVHNAVITFPSAMNMFVAPGEASTDINSDNSIAKENRTRNTDNNSTADINIASAQTKASQKNKEKTAADIVKENDKPWREDFAFRNKPKTNTFRQKASLGYYITPSFGYRGFFKNSEDRNAARMASGSDKLNDGAALNLEIGAALQYRISKAIRLKAGLQGNYTNYVSKVTQLQHPTQVTLAVSNRSTALRASEYSVKSGLARLNKSTFQIAMPLGADLKIAGSNKIRWYLGAAIQPTYVISGNAYVLSDDAKNYISETPLLRKWNMNAAVETFVSFRPATGVTLTVGPQFRYQLLSTYKKEYNYTEKLYNIGMKIGLSTDF